MTAVANAETDSLAAIEEGADIEIVDSLLPADDSHESLLRAGSRWHCRLSGNAVILLNDRTGRLVSVRRDTARFVRVRTAR